MNTQILIGPTDTLRLIQHLKTPSRTHKFDPKLIWKWRQYLSSRKEPQKAFGDRFTTRYSCWKLFLTFRNWHASEANALQQEVYRSIIRVKRSVLQNAQPLASQDLLLGKNHHFGENLQPFLNDKFHGNLSCRLSSSTWNGMHISWQTVNINSSEKLYGTLSTIL